jgi:CHASE3 domain sensor protein
MKIATRLSLMFVGAACIVLIIGLTSYISVSNLIASNQLFSHSREVLQELNLLLYNLSDTVGTQRAYMITGQEIYLDAYKALVASTNDSLQQIRQLVSDNPAQAYKVEKLSLLVKERLASLETTNELYQQKGVEAAIYRVRTGNSVKFRISLHKAIDEIKSTETDLLQKREKELKHSAASTQLTIIASSLLGLILLTLFSYLFGRYILSNLSQVIRAMDNIKYNRFDLSMPANADDEFGELFSAFNIVSHRLLTMANELNKREEEIAAIMSEMQANEHPEIKLTTNNGLLDRFNNVIQLHTKQSAAIQKSLANLPSAVEVILKSWQEMLQSKGNEETVHAGDKSKQWDKSDTL